MGKHSVLKSVAHNWAEHFLSDWIFVDDSIMVQHLFEAARASGSSTIVLHPLAETVEPEQCRTASVIHGMQGASRDFEDILHKQGCSLDMVREVALSITFDLSVPTPSYAEVKPGVYYSPDIRMPDAPAYNAEVRLTDDRGRVHIANVREFWRN
jgi:hypothetical protein